MEEGGSKVFGLLLLVVGLAFTVAGFIVLFIQKVLPQGRLPGDLLIKRGNFTLYFPIVTSILLSVLLSLLLVLLFKFFNR